MTDCPLRLVDEINQGMDEVNERMIFDQIVQNACKPVRNNNIILCLSFLLLESYKIKTIAFSLTQRCHPDSPLSSSFLFSCCSLLLLLIFLLQGLPQYFLITPKLLSGLQYGDDVTILYVFNGPFLGNDDSWRNFIRGIEGEGGGKAEGEEEEDGEAEEADGEGDASEEGEKDEESEGEILEKKKKVKK